MSLIKLHQILHTFWRRIQEIPILSQKPTVNPHLQYLSGEGARPIEVFF
jgi:hypothetical protein